MAKSKKYGLSATGKIKVWLNDNGYPYFTIAKKDDDGEYVNMFVNLFITENSGIDLDDISNGDTIRVNDGFFSFNETDKGKKFLKLVVMDGEIIDTGDEDEKPKKNTKTKRTADRGNKGGAKKPTKKKPVKKARDEDEDEDEDDEDDLPF